MKIRIRRPAGPVSRFGIAAAAVLAFLATAVQPASAASVGCGSACNETDPSQPVWSSQLGATVTCAADAITAKQAALGEGITLQLRYSPRCRTVWARFYGGSSNRNTYVASVYSTAWYPAYRGLTELPSQPTGRNWSDQMDDAGITAKACIGTSWTFLNNIGCTAAY